MKIQGKFKVVLCLVFIAATGVFAKSNTEELVSGEALKQIKKQIYEDSFHIQKHQINDAKGDKQETLYRAINISNQLAIDFPDSGGFTTSPIRKKGDIKKYGQWTWGLRPTYYGNSEQQVQLAKPFKSNLSKEQLNLHYNTREGFVEWYKNIEKGLEQGFTIQKAPFENAGKLLVGLAVSGNLNYKLDRQQQELKMTDKQGNVVLFYNKLMVYDAEKKRLPAHFEFRNSHLEICVNSENAVFPVVIDPMTSTAQWSQLGFGNGDAFGFSAANAGDVNGDGYSDIVIGAPNANASDGRVYIYHGSAMGLQATPDKTIDGTVSNTSYANVVAGAGDVNGDGYSDIIVCDPGYNSADGIVYIYHGGSSGINTTAAKTIAGKVANAGYFGIAVASAGDTNGDGYCDIIIGASDYDNGAIKPGKAYIFKGSASGITGDESTPFWEKEGSANLDYFGYSVANAGDVNGDGYADIIVGAYNYNGGNGIAYVFHGGPTIDTTNDWSGTGTGRYGKSVSGAGDVNGDGYSDIIVGAELESSAVGHVYVYHGSAAGVNGAATWDDMGGTGSSKYGARVAFAGDLNGDGYGDVLVTDIGYNAGNDTGRVFAFFGSASGITGDVNAPGWSSLGAAASDQFGYAISGGGDVNGDGLSDIIIGAPYNGGSNQGSVYAFYGAPCMIGEKHSISGEGGSDQFGYSLAAAGDVNGDGYADIIIGTPFNTSMQGRVYLFHGSYSGISGTATDANWTALGENANDMFGSAVDGAGDVNNDGYADIIIGAANYQTDKGRIYIFHGSASGITGSPSTANWILTGNAGDYLGSSLASAGDINGDGFADVIVGSDSMAGTKGQVFTFHGGSGGIIGDLATPAWTTSGAAAGDQLGMSVNSAGDVNGDGFGDVIVGARGVNSLRGKAYVFHGSPTGITGDIATPNWGVEGEFANDEFSHSVASAGDVNSDGFGDIIVGAYKYNGGNNGKVYVYHGSGSGLSAAANWSLEGNAAGWFITSVAGVGDIDNDGFDDVMFGSSGTSGSDGVAYLFSGGPSGVVAPNLAAAIWMYMGATGDNVGYNVRGAGDINGDGFADVLVTRGFGTNGGGNGSMHIYHGDNVYGRKRLVTLIDPVTSQRIQPWGGTQGDGYKVRMYAQSPRGRENVKLEVETVPQGVKFGDAGTINKQSVLWQDTGVSTDGVLLEEEFTGLTPGALYSHRARILYSPKHIMTPPLKPLTSQWIYFETDFRGTARITQSPPTLQTELITFSFITSSEMKLTWNSGNGSSRLVLAHAGGPVDAFPGDGMEYTANSVFATGEQLGTGNYAVYKGTGNSVTVTGLSSGTVYHFKVFDYNGTASTTKYLLADAPDNPNSQQTNQLPMVTTQPVDQIVNIAATARGNLTALGIPSPSQHGFCWNTTGSPSISDPNVDLGAIAAVGPFSAHITGLTPGTTYFVKAFAANSSGIAYGTEVSFSTPAGIISLVSPDNGPLSGGNSVKITGTDLGEGDIVAVKLNEIPAAITSQTSTEVIVVAGTASIAGTGNVIVVSSGTGTKVLPNGYTYNSPGTISLVSPNSGPLSGGNSVKITGTDLGANDIVEVKLNGIPAAISSQTPSEVVVVAGIASIAGTGSVSVTSSSRGTAVLPNGYTYNSPGTITSVDPAFGPVTGGNSVKITGTNLGDGVDITSVSLNGHAATINSQTINEVIVTAGTGVYGVGDVVVNSKSRGISSKTNGYTYKPFIYVSPGPNGNITPGGNVPVDYGTDMTFTFNPDPSYKVREVFIDGNPIGPVDTYTFVNVTMDHNLQADFELAINHQPTIDPVPDMAVDENSAEQVVKLTGISDGDGGIHVVTITAQSDNPDLIPTPIIEYKNPDTTGLLKFTPVAAKNGKATITVTVKDNGGTGDGSTDTTQISFSVRVLTNPDIVRDIAPGAKSSDIQYLTAIGDLLYFRADDGKDGCELWRSNGTEQGTKLVLDINPGPDSSFPYSFAKVDGTLFFTANNGSNGYELWRSAGGPATTAMVQDIFPGAPSSSPYNSTGIGGVLYFSADTATVHGGLWRSDGSPGGTSLINAFADSKDNYYCRNFTDVAGTLFFSADDGTSGAELWRSNGLPANTVMVKNIAPESGCNPHFLTPFKGSVFFSANDGSNHTQLWKSNGAAAGTEMVKKIRSGSNSDPYCFVAAGDTLFFSADDGTHGFELWRTDGTTAGTKLVKDIYIGQTSSFPADMVVIDGTLYFSATTGKYGNELWKSDGTAEGTVLVKDIVPGENGSYPTNLVNVNGVLCFAAFEEGVGDELFRSDGTEEGTLLVKDINPGPSPSEPDQLTVLGNTLYFVAGNDGIGRELWRYIPTVKERAQIQIALDVYPTDGGSVSPAKRRNCSIKSGIPFNICATPADGYMFVNWNSADNVKIYEAYDAETSLAATNNATVTANFAPEDNVVSLTIKIDDNGGGLVFPRGKIMAIKGIKLPIIAKPTLGFVFEKWVTDGDVVIENALSAKTVIIPSANAVIQARFVKGVDLSVSPVVTISYDSLQPQKSRIAIQKMALPADFVLSVAPSNAYLSVDGSQIQFDKADNWANNGAVWKYIERGKQGNILLTLDTAAKRWSLIANKQTLAALDNTNGIDFVLKLDDQLIASNLLMKEKLCWTFNSAQVDSVEPLPVTGKEMTLFKVKKSNCKFSTSTNKATFTVNRGKIQLDESSSSIPFDSSVDPVILSVDSETIVINPGSFDEKNQAFKYKGHKSKNNLFFFFKNNKWFAKLPGLTAGNITPEDGIDVHLSIGDYEGAVRLNGHYKKIYRYKATK